MPAGTAAVPHEPSHGRGGGSFERVTVNLTEKASNALAESMEASRDSKTD